MTWIIAVRTQLRKGGPSDLPGRDQRSPPLGTSGPRRDKSEWLHYGMKIFPRRALPSLLAAALLLGSVPPQAQAQVARVAAGRTGGMPISPAFGAQEEG